MTEKQFLASKYKPFEIMTVFIKELNRNCECILVGINFEKRIFKLRPIDIEMWNDGLYKVKIDVISRGSAKLRVIN